MLRNDQGAVFEGLELITAPATEPLTLEEAKLWLRVDHEDENALITALTKFAREFFETQTGRALITQTWRVSWDLPPPGNYIELPRPPLQEITSVQVRDSDGDYSAVDAADWTTDTASFPGRLKWINRPTYDTTYPEALRITYTAGHGDASADVPPEYVHAVRLILAHAYEERRPVQDRTMSVVPLALSTVISAHKVYRL